MTPTPDKNSLKCRFCDWTTPKALTTKGGKFRGVDAANQRLQDHVFVSHFDEWQAIQAQLDETCRPE